ncbi:hypothetical protein LJC68_05955 [Bacteroidales bacterium OttesenSCG-928-B11]|nr:hypothetical protein [Bacteroidales bacterium OttesenSCG-928-B11]MDL2326305.1 hypothetical protein [Bacteroidales bacterium OttesenSCG-928-A14]
MRNILLPIIISILFCACNSANKNLLIFEEKDGLCAFILNENINVWTHYSMPIIGDLAHVDSIDIFRDDVYFVKKKIPKIDFIFDSLYAANIFDLYGDWVENIVLYNARIYEGYWDVGVYYPFHLKGTYTFSISEEERILYNSLLFLCDTISSNIYPPKGIIDSLNEIGYLHNHDFYVSIFQKGNEKSVFSVYPYLPENMYRLSQLTSVIINNHIRQIPPTTSFIGGLDIREKFNQRFQCITGDGKVYNYVHDIDSMKVWLDSLRLDYEKSNVRK